MTEQSLSVELIATEMSHWEGAYDWCELCGTVWPEDALSYSHALDMTLCPLHPSYKPSGK